MKRLIAYLLHKLGFPGMVTPMRYYDHKTGLDISIRCSVNYTILKVNNKEFFFWRESGKLDGIGQMEEPTIIET